MSSTWLTCERKMIYAAISPLRRTMIVKAFGVMKAF
jgi:hypothetical protein